jgi:tRNA pseudouridine55 synthase
MIEASGLLNIDKPPRLTSRDVVDRVQALVPPTKVGHAGTLDPLATGVLLVCLGNATRLVPYLNRSTKIYRADFRFGLRSDTDDADGEVEAIVAPQPGREELLAALLQFRGPLDQVPPQFSAVRVGGRRAYQLAREKKNVDLAPKPVVIYRLDLLSFEYPDLQLEVECSSGTYIRSLGRDLASALGTSAIMTRLVRSASGPFRLEQSVQLDQLDAQSLASHMQPLRAGLQDWPWIQLDEQQRRRVLTGQGIELFSQPDERRELAAADAAGRLVAILVRSGGRSWKPDRCFAVPDPGPATN